MYIDGKWIKQRKARLLKRVRLNIDVTVDSVKRIENLLETEVGEDYDSVEDMASFMIDVGVQMAEGLKTLEAKET